jgi:hypothetical protein
VNELETCPVCTRDWRFPLNHRECVEALQARVLVLEADGLTVNPNANDLDPSLLGDSGLGCLVLAGLVVLVSLGLLFWWLQR